MGESVFSPNICRLCGKENDETSCLFEKIAGSSPASLIKKYLPMKVRKNDLLPKQICKCCKDELERICEFISRVLETQTKLGKIAGGKPSRKSDRTKSATQENVEELVTKPDFTLIDMPMAPLVEVKLENEDPDDDPVRHAETLLGSRSLDEEEDDDDEAVEEDREENGDDEEDSEWEASSKAVKPDDDLPAVAMMDSSDESEESSDADSDYEPSKKKPASPRSPRKRMGSPSAAVPEVKEKKKRGRKPKPREPQDALIKEENDDFSAPKRTRVKREKEPCPRCGKRINPSYMQRHVMLHDLPPGEKPPRQRLEPGEKPVYMCHECGKVFAQKGNLDAHMRTHTGEKPFKCDLCPKAFSQKGNLDEHRRMHTNERPFCCEICGVRFVRQSQIKIHMRTHTGQRPYCCNFCPQSFKRLQTLRKHQRMHLDLRPYPCDMCDKRFRDRDKLIVHRRIHTGERPYKCSVCGRGFYESGNLFKHAKVHQKDGAIGALDRSLVIMDPPTEGEREEFKIRPKYDCYLCATEFTDEKQLIEHMVVHEKELKNHVKSDGRRGAKKSAPRRKNSNESAPPSQPQQPQMPQLQPLRDDAPAPHQPAAVHDEASSRDFALEQFESCTNSTIGVDAKIEPRSPECVATPSSSSSNMPVFPPSLYPMWPFGGHT